MAEYLNKSCDSSMKDIKILHMTEHKKKSKHEKKIVTQKSLQNEIYYTIQALLFTVFILGLSYHGLCYGCMEYSLLENGRIVNGFVPPRKAVVTISIGYSVPFAIVYSITACMLLYSIISMSPRWSLPLIFFSISDIMCNVGDAFVAFWLLFTRLPLSTAITYMTGAASIIMGELWVWFGVLRLYELKTFD